MKSDLEEKLDQAAHHEAAHVVVAYIMGLAIKQVWIDPKGHHPAENMLVGPFPEDLDLRPEAERRIMYLFAGEVQDQIDNRRESGASRDDYEAFHLAVQAERGDSTKARILRERSTQQVQALLSEPRHQSAVEALANALLERLCLGGDEAIEIVRQALQEID